jgi:hypothetical protein
MKTGNEHDDAGVGNHRTIGGVMRVPDWTTWQSVNDEFEGSVSIPNECYDCPYKDECPDLGDWPECQYGMDERGTI